MTHALDSILQNIIVTYSDFQYPDFTWERQTQGVILGAFFYGYIFTQIPGGYLATKFGGKRIFLIGIAATSVMTLLTPFLTHRGIGFLITTRVLEGLFEVRTKSNLAIRNFLVALKLIPNAKSSLSL